MQGLNITFSANLPVTSTKEFYKCISTMKKVALPVIEGELNPHFGYSQKFKLVYVDNQNVVKEEMITPPFQEPELLPAWLSEKGITDLITSGIDFTSASIFQLNGINVLKGAQVKNCCEIIHEFINGTLITEDSVYLQPE